MPGRKLAKFEYVAYLAKNSKLLLEIRIGLKFARLISVLIDFLDTKFFAKIMNFFCLTKNLQTHHLSFCRKPTITGLVNITWCNMMLWNSTNSIQVRWYREGESQLLDSVMVLGATKDEPTSSVLTLVPQRTTDGAVYRWRWWGTRWWWSVESGNLEFKKNNISMKSMLQKDIVSKGSPPSVSEEISFKDGP